MSFMSFKTFLLETAKPSFAVVKNKLKDNGEYGPTTVASVHETKEKAENARKEIRVELEKAGYVVRIV